jgi:hypothetical protein
MASIVIPLLAWLAEISTPLLAWLVKKFFGPDAYQIAKSCLGPFVCCGNVVPLALGWSVNGDVDHEKVCVCHTHCL